MTLPRANNSHLWRPGKEAANGGGPQSSLRRKVAHEYGGYELDLLDLIQEGNVGLLQAVKRFDPEKGFRLISYAVWWIRAFIRSFSIRTWSLVKLGTTRPSVGMSTEEECRPVRRLVSSDQLIVILRGLCASAFGRTKARTPFSSFAEILSVSIRSPKVKRLS
jgi:RNA polymerase sigma factor (sigma-70 family)